MKSRIRRINKPVLTQLNSFINDSNVSLNMKKELIFDIPPISFESTLEKLMDGSSTQENGKLAELQVKELWRMFGKYIYGGKSGYRDQNEEQEKEDNQLKKLFDMYQHRVDMDKAMLSDFTKGRKVSMKNLQFSSTSRSRSPESPISEVKQVQQVHFKRIINNNRR